MNMTGRVCTIVAGLYDQGRPKAVAMPVDTDVTDHVSRFNIVTTFDLVNRSGNNGQPS